jgi:dihydrofolate synthase/folylpolyglutamate synthase
MPHWPIPHGKKPIDLGLTRIKKFLQRLGNPHLSLPPVVHVAGTNGKGSTIAFLKTIFEHAGYKVHRYTSPHLVNFNERIYLAGSDIEDGYLTQLAEECRISAGDIPITFFEGTTAMAFLAFARKKADILLLEVGMGGRLDATNVIENPMLTIITPVSFDHMEYLGNTIAQIASEKAGIIKKNTPCVISWQYQEALSAIKTKASTMTAPLYCHGEDWNFQVNPKGFDFFDKQETYKLPKPSLMGAHQIINAATAIAATQLLAKDFNISMADVMYGLQNTFWPARLHQITKGKLAGLLPADWELWIDGAHNAHAAQMLSAQVDLWNDKPTYIINGRTANRDIKGFLMPFAGKVEMVCAVPIYSEPLAENPTNILRSAQELGFKACECQSLSEAVQVILQGSHHPHGARILICGSLYLSADINLEL